jgi:hypothetical protein
MGFKVGVFFIAIGYYGACKDHSFDYVFSCTVSSLVNWFLPYCRSYGT